MNNNFNILPKFTGKYIHKSIKLIVFYVVLPVIVAIILLIVFDNEKLINLLSAL